MIISCTNCDTKYRAEDSKVVNKKFAFTCPNCEAEVIIDNRVKKDEEIALLERPAPGRTEIMDEDVSDGFVMPEEGEDSPAEEDFDIKIPDDLDEPADDDFELNLAEDTLPTEDILENSALSDESLSTDADNDLIIPDADDTIESFEDISGADDLDSIELNLEEITAEDIQDQDDEEIENIDITEEFDIELEDAADTESPAPKHTEIEEDEEFQLVDDDLNIVDITADDLHLDEDSEMAADEPAMDIPVEEMDMEQVDEKITVDDVKSEEIFALDSQDTIGDDDTDITIDLDSLDIQLEEIEGEEELLTGEDVDSDMIDDLPLIDEDLITTAPPSSEIEEEDITLDLDSLDLNLDETGETMEGEVVDDDERISLADAGLTPDELIVDTDNHAEAEPADDELRINISEVTTEDDEEISLASEEMPVIDEMPLSEEDDLLELPEIDLDEFEKSEMAEDNEIEPVHDIDFFEDRETITPAQTRRPVIKEIEDAEQDIYDTVPGGTVHFSIDYSLNFSRIGALLRLTGLYLVGLIPNILISVVYTVLSLLLGIINWILIIITGQSVDDYTEIQENTLRRLISTGASCMDLVEEMPVFSGRKDIDYSVQFEVTYPLKYSRILAALRLSIAGIIIITLPHILMLIILTMGSIPICIAGLFSVLIKKSWPNILFDSMVKFWSYASNVLSYIIGLVDKYPKFKFE